LIPGCKRHHAGHDAWGVGDEPYVAVDFADEFDRYAKPS
jgi:hypothetical protein